MPGAGTATLLTAAAGDVLSFIGGIVAGDNARTASAVTAGTISQVSELNAQLIEQGTELNAGVHDFNAAALEGQAKDAITRGKEQENLFRKQLKGLIGSQRASYAAQGVEVSQGSALDVQADTAYQGELDALQLRTNAAREAWGYSTQAEGERLQATNTRKLGALQAKNTRDVGRANANNARITGQNAASTANWGAASSLLSGTTNILANKYGWK